MSPFDAGPFDAGERRVLGTLIEKESTVPDTYPMTLKGLVAGCNQKNNREPITDLDPVDVQRTLDGLKARGVVRFVHPSHGARSTKYRHVLDEAVGLDRGELALVGVLFLRGPQTLAELRTRTERAHPFASLEATEAALEGLAGRDEPVVVHLARQVGQKETRWMHLLGDGSLDVPDEAPASEDLSSRVARLEARLTAIESVLADLGVSPSSGND